MVRYPNRNPDRRRVGAWISARWTLWSCWGPVASLYVGRVPHPISGKMMDSAAKIIKHQKPDGFWCFSLSTLTLPDLSPTCYLCPSAFACGASRDAKKPIISATAVILARKIMAEFIDLFSHAVFFRTAHHQENHQHYCNTRKIGSDLY